MHDAMTLDLMRSVLAWPGAPHLWRRLSAHVAHLPDNPRRNAVQMMADWSFSDKSAQWLQHGAVASLTQNWDWIAQQASLVDNSIPLDAVMNFITLTWHRALTRTQNLSEFAQRMRSCGIPELLLSMASRLPDAAPQKQGNPRAVPRVAIYTPDISNSLHAGTSFALNILSILSLIGHECKLFTAQEMTIPNSDSYHGGDETIGNQTLDVKNIFIPAPGNHSIFIPDTAFSLSSRLQSTLFSIHEYEPDFIIFVGLFSPIATKLFQSYPTVGISLHAIPPFSPVDVWLAADMSAWNETAQSAPMAPKHAAHFPYRFWPVGKARPLERADMGIPRQATLMVSVGVRLHLEISQAWAEEMLAKINARQDLHWLLIGLPDGRAAGYVPVHPRVHCCAPLSNVPQALAMADFYVNPPRIGGGASVAQSMEQGLPVVTLAGSDGGDKVGEHAAPSMQGYFALIDAWTNDPQARRQAGLEMQSSFHARLDISVEAARRRMIEACQLAYQTFLRRHVV